ncbi:MAG: ATP-binding cassette domain-containing protein [Lachnospiraceae bacterium]|nr:ATP-binding cassette domain-containing protein [Lachnospiraceae bacterium]
MNKQWKKIGYGMVSVVLWVMFWQIMSRKIDQTMFLPSPWEVWNALRKLMASPEFYQSILNSLGNIVLGAGGACILGALLAAVSSRVLFLRLFFGLPVRMMQAVPVASFTILALFWLDAGKLSVLVSFFMVFPLMYSNVRKGIEAADQKLLEMAKVYQVRWYHTLRFIYLPELIPYFLSACSVAAGVAWKSGIAAEVIGVVRNTIGNQLYQAKIYLEMPELFAWTAVIICLSLLFELGILGMVRLMEYRLLAAEKVTEGRWDRKLVPQAEPVVAESPGFWMDSVTKHFDDVIVCVDFSMKASGGEAVALMGSSGKGKTTLLRMLLKLETPDCGRIEADEQAMAVVFQEDRLCEKVSVYHNLAMVCRTPEQLGQIENLLGCLGLAGCGEKKAGVLSGGMKRRVAIARALLADRRILLLDEPLKGLDDRTKTAVMEFMKEKMQGRTVLYVTHEETEAEYFGCRIVRV